MHSKAFDGLKGNFPIGFLIWDMSKKADIDTITTKIFDKDANEIGEKNFYNISSKTFLNVWLKRPKANKEIVIPLKNSVSVYDKKVHLQNWSDNAIAYLWCDSNDFQKSSTMTALFSSVWGQGHGFYVTPDNLWQAAIVFAVRRLIKPTWINDRDQFLQPSQNLTDAFKTDCLVWMLFNGSNVTAGASGLEWGGKSWDLVNHFIPFREDEVGAGGRFASDFMVRYLAGLKPSPQSRAVLDAGRALWRLYHATKFERKIRDEYRLNRFDAGWYQIRKALEANGDNQMVDFAPFKQAYAELTEKLRPMVYELGFLK